MSKLKDALKEYNEFEHASRFFGGVHTPVSNYIKELESAYRDMLIDMVGFIITIKNFKQDVSIKRAVITLEKYEGKPIEEIIK